MMNDCEKRKGGKTLLKAAIAALPILLMAWSAWAISMPSGLTYVWWHFGVPKFQDLQIDFTIEKDLPERPGVYLQFYQGKIGDTGFYFGFQSDILDPRVHKGRGKGVIFSRWGTRDLDNSRPVTEGWEQSAGYEGDFIGIRREYDWTDHSYRFRLTRIEADDVGVWYGLFILDKNTGVEDYAGAIRFPLKENGEEPMIHDGGGSWTEVYSGAKEPSDLPHAHVSISGAYANNRQVRAKRAVSRYSKVPNSDIYYDSENKTVHMEFGPDVKREHPKAVLYDETKQ